MHKAPAVTKQPEGKDSPRRRLGGRSKPPRRASRRHGPVGSLHRRRQQLEPARRRHLEQTDDRAATTAQTGYEYRAVFTNEPGTGDEQRPPRSPSSRRRPSPTSPSARPSSRGETAVFEAAASGITDADGAVGSVDERRRHLERRSPEPPPTQLSIAGAKASQSGNEYRAVFKNSAGTATTNAPRADGRQHQATTRSPGGRTPRASSATAPPKQSATAVPPSGLNFVTRSRPAGATASRCSQTARVIAWGEQRIGQLGDESNDIEQRAGRRARGSARVDGDRGRGRP